MAFLPIQMPPGFYRGGTEYQSKGRWYDGNLIRFYAGTIRPHKGWRVKSTTALTGMGRAILGWANNSGTTRVGIGTYEKLYVLSRAGQLFDITPVGYTPGNEDAIIGGGYGTGLYGVGTYGTPRSDATAVQPATIWTLDLWGENLVGMTMADGKAWKWAGNTATPAAAISNAPTGNGLVVTPEYILMILGANGNARRAQWSDQGDNTNWTPSSTNQAGAQDLQTEGTLMCGLKINGGTLIFSDRDAFLATYTGGQFIYRFDRIGDGCGVVSQNCAVAVAGMAVWMGQNGFWLYDGYAKPLPCDVWEYVFSDINRQQMSKATVEDNSEFGEVTWRYPSASSVEVDRYVTWNYRENHWVFGTLARTVGMDAGLFTYPLRAGTDGYIYEHEVALDYSGSELPWLEGGPMELGNGDNVMHAVELIPDEATEGSVTATFLIRFYPEAAQTSFGPYSLSSRTDVRFGGRQVSVRYAADGANDFRIGAPRLNLRAGGQR